MTRFSALAAVILLAACQPPMPIEEPMPQTPAPMLLGADPAGGLEERMPDTCKAIDYVAYLGQPGGVIATIPFTQPHRVVEWRGIEAQEYNPQRVVFRLDAAGNIYNIDCG
ncbi:I78 family peptidase inhibitor [Phaeovulum sp. NW3]|uniref:I78 family peptidase inhibitor n=1 Tax=Phaeovulum sp. NW3 TaxID=2934933 RepID=UPI002021F539|nr:I78 family peptidase inhibitor [Phaeovulum sp. NW3]MCL7463567.1 I78 family peptidase inhibitor [Phaeovulum sp. NW3]